MALPWRRMLLIVVIGGIGAAAGFYLWGSAPQSHPSSRVPRDDVERGGKLYRRFCATCHGRQGRGEGPAGRFMDPPPLNFHSDTVARWTNRELFEKISEGKLKTGMPAWENRLSAEQRRAIVRYLRRAFIQTPDDVPSDPDRGAGSGE